MYKLLFLLIPFFCFANPIVTIETNYGPIEVILFEEEAPKACENFLRLAEEGAYANTPFHRVIPDFMIQGGDTGWDEPFEDEFSETLAFDMPGRLGMANAGPNTNRSQFFITTVPTPWLNKTHTLFGQVINGYATVKKIESLGSATGSTKPWFWEPEREEPVIISIVRKS